MSKNCPADNTVAEDQSAFWGEKLDAHRIGWLISGACAAVVCRAWSLLVHDDIRKLRLYFIHLNQTVVISLVSVLKHAS